MALWDVAEVKQEVIDAQTPVTTYNDGTFILTALVVDHDVDGGCISVVDKNGNFLFMLNLYHFDDHDCVDVICMDNRVMTAFALKNGRQVLRESRDVRVMSTLIGME